ncbi:helix-turn-helix domain-containing protein [Propionivibrio sp.]|uniref:helix-turn-helix domain-containing protein n=1 Tax=Propionivibrio sp. TaxID=2212460 RepID=UPI003BF1710F
MLLRDRELPIGGSHLGLFRLIPYYGWRPNLPDEADNHLIKLALAGNAIAKGEGKYLGRRSALTNDQVQEMRRRAAAGDKKVAIARDFGISRETLYQKLRDSVIVTN